MNCFAHLMIIVASGMVFAGPENTTKHETPSWFVLKLKKGDALDAFNEYIKMEKEECFYKEKETKVLRIYEVKDSTVAEIKYKIACEEFSKYPLNLDYDGPVLNYVTKKERFEYKWVDKKWKIKGNWAIPDEDSIKKEINGGN